MKRPDFIDFEILNQIISLNLTYAIILLVVAYLFFLYLPRRIFPQTNAGAGIENIISNILYMLVFIELAVPLMVFLQIFNVFTFIGVIIALKLFFVRFYEKRNLKEYLTSLRIRIVIVLLEFFDNYKEIIKNFKRKKEEEFFLYLKNINYYQLFKKLLIVFIFVHLVYILGFRCFISLANPLSDTSQFFEWVANLDKNILYADNKTAGADFYGISVLIFILYKITHIDTIVLFNIYPILLILFLLFGVYFVIKRFSVSSLIALLVLLIFGSLFIGSPLNDYIATPITTTNNPDIINFFGFKIYNVPASFYEHFDLNLERVSRTPIIRYFSGMAYEHSSAMFLLNLFYLIKAIDTGRTRFLVNYTLTLMLVFIFHGGGAIALIVPSIFIAINAILHLKLTWNLLKRGLIAIVIAAIFGNGWVLSVFKYGIPQDFGAAAPFLDRLFGTKQAVNELVASGIEDVTISTLTPLHLSILLITLFFFVLALVWRKRFYFSSFLLIPLGFFVVFYAENLGLPKLVHPSRGAEYLFLSLTIVTACFIKLFLWLPLKLMLRRIYKIVFLIIVYCTLLISIFIVPHYKDLDEIKQFINGVQYSSVPLFLYKIVKSNKPFTWTVVSYVQEYSKVLGKGYMINVNEFITKYDPNAKYLPIPTKKVYIFVEDIPHKYTGKDEWFYRWRKDIEENLKNWIAIYNSTHKNVTIFAKSKLVTVYEIDNSAYIKYLERKNDQ
ncbi:hypothetical protein [Nitratiruptor sp. YY09-18]|uniref:hypothetical protein n=1 Tax=Nitratiruptor sp. YY09-18 TaxID=2724901 RepID=UPI00191565B6|nr:hypothetical protein [Nitratiruptor sp. YY09-18]BCD67687.1 hypothetical protein NitYY0918_C0588 [Nitratiruptor sp. YY09-18]